MSIKALQVMLIIAAVLCAVGLAATFGQGGCTQAANFNPPGWLRSLQGLADGSRLTAQALTRDGRPFPAELRLGVDQTAIFSVAPAEDTDLRRAEFTVRGNVRIHYRPVHGQKLRGELAEEQRWPEGASRDAEPTFVVYDRGGTLTIHNRGRGMAQVNLKD